MDDRLVKIGCAVVLFVAFSAILALLWRVLFAHKVEPAWMRRPRGISLGAAYALTGAVGFAYAISIDFFDPACSGPFPYGEPPECAWNPNLPEPLDIAVLSLLVTLPVLLSKRFVLAALACPLSAVCAFGFMGAASFGAAADNAFTVVFSFVNTAILFPYGFAVGVFVGGIFLLGGAFLYVAWILAWRRITRALR
ncbi:hypothetical protein HMPREF1219_01439 [Corynebacterium pyruviciproducens ATCC BAA-1742]|uniref:Uncharacterized protein n=1 Tax=Corynebacterium pyruviciproducens ATCC BAA-1742 TaxID=1125779 RepID=S2ZYT0_9CORY|nr:hypothetical protein [Corynebacterium pyruviciproducens]EPD69214.1 hypothetical protein HMPREF1219_01439 [Corynebacterium pyruviciproducens ATCC BAA-1742]